MKFNILVLIAAALLASAGCAGQAASAPAALNARPVVYAWFPRNLDDWDTSSIDWSAITHISYRNIVVTADGALSWTTSPDKVKALVTEAHRHGVRVTVLVWSDSSRISSAYLAECPGKMAQSLVDYVKANDLDGVCIDDESCRPTNRVTNRPNRELVTNFFALLRQKLKAARADYELAFACPCTPKGEYAWYDWPGIAEQVDHLAIMSYCVTPLHLRQTAGFQPIAGGIVAAERPGRPSWTRDYTHVVQDFVEAVGPKNRNKLLLGIDIQRIGAEWRCASDRPHAEALAGARKIQLEEATAKAAKYGRRFDPLQQTAWYCYRDGKDYVQGWYDDDQTLAMKFKFARQANLGGVCLWVLRPPEPPSTFQIIHKELLKSTRATVGAIRWDAWFGDKGMPGQAVEKSLGPQLWHGRLPFYGKVLSDTQVQARGDTQEIMDREIEYAAGAGLDYWAFLTYNTGDPMTRALDLYLSSKHRTKIGFCVILHHIRQDALQDEARRIVGYLKEPGYQKVLGGRPLVYMLRCEAPKAFYDDIRKSAVEAGLKEPYFVQMDGDKASIGALGFDAVSAYCYWMGGGREPATPYAAVAKGAQERWDAWKLRGLKCVPLVSAGLDRRPRVQNPVPWETSWEKGAAGDPATWPYAQPPRPTELAAHVQAALDWIKTNPTTAEANTAIIYAWNEFDEGGWICPTLTEGTARLDAIRAVLRRPAE